MEVASQLPDGLRLLQEAVNLRDDASFEIVDEQSLRLAKVTVKEKVFYPSAVKIPKYPLNNANTAELVTDKAYTNLILDRERIKRTEGKYFFAREHNEQFNLPGVTEANTYAAELGYPVFVKPNRGAFGSQADVCFSADELAAHAAVIATSDYVFHVQRLYNEREFRMFCVDGEIQFGYERTRPAVTGDGTQTVSELIAEINKKTDYDIQCVSLKGYFLHQQLRSKNLSLQSVLGRGEKLQVSAAANIVRGGQISNLLCNDFSPTLKELAVRLYEIFNIRVCGVDFFASSFTGSDIVVIELNNNPSLKGLASVNRPFAISVWHTILDKFALS